MGKTDKFLNVPISKPAQEIVVALPHRLFPWTDKAWWLERGELNQRDQVRHELRRSFGGKRDVESPSSPYEPSISLSGDNCLKRGETYCLSSGIRLHTFRHTFAMWKLADGCPMEVIKDLLGHSDLRMA